MPIFYSDAAPVILYSGTYTTLTNFIQPDYNFNDHDFIMHTSVITGKRTIVSKGTYYSAKLSLLAPTYALYSTLKNLRGKVVSFYPYGTANIVIGAAAYSAPIISMIVTKAKFYHLNERLWTDACLMELISESYYELGLTLVGT